MRRGIVTEIERFALKDGPGIRTVVFLKGCNLSCKWCHNPETLRIKPQILYYPDKCIGCGACIRVCRYGARTPLGLDHGKCTGCGECAAECFSGALLLSGRKMSVDEVMAEVMQDRRYYENSGGGITLSGGEAACQPGFALELLKAAHREGIQTAIETNLSLSWEVYAQLLPETDLLMFDLKARDSELHKKWTGSGNAQILSNARRAAELVPSYIVRTPVIPGVNDTVEEIAGIAGFIASLSGRLRYYELLRYNPLGEGKYTALGTESSFAGSQPERMEQMEALAAAAGNAGVSAVRIG